MEIIPPQPSETPKVTSQTRNSAAETVISSDFETFLKMLTTQLENQDPLDPVKSEDFAVQLATFSGVEQQVYTNDLLSALIEQSNAAGLGQFSDWVGMEARVAAPAYFDGTPIQISPKPSLTAERATLVVENEFGAEVQRVEIDVSHDLIEWSGIINDTPALPGNYSFKVESYTNGEIEDTKLVEIYTFIEEVRVDGSATVLVLNGGNTVDAGAVTGLRPTS